MTEHSCRFYGKNAKLGYISNRVNSYSMNPQAWDKVQKKYNIDCGWSYCIL